MSQEKEIDCQKEQDLKIKTSSKLNKEIKDQDQDVQEVNSKSLYFTSEDKNDWPQGGHLPRSGFFKDGKIVTKTGLRYTKWIDTTQ